MKKWILAAALIVACGTAVAGNSNSNPCGNNGNNCDTGGATAIGGNATGGNAYAGAAAGSVAGATAGAKASVGDVTNVAHGGAGGSSVAFGGAGGRGGDANQAQGQHQGQSQSNIGINGQHQSARSDQSQSSTNTQSTDASSRNDNKSTASGNSTSVGGQSVTINEAEQPDDITIRQAPTMMVSAPYATVSCYKTFGGSVSGILGAIGASGGRIDQSCEHRELVRVAASVDPEGAKNVLCLNQMYGIANPKQCAGVRPVILLDKKAARQYRANQSAK